MLQRLFAKLILLALLLPLAATAQNNHPPHNQPLTRASSQQVFMVTLIPPAKPIAVNDMHSWQLRLTTADGNPVSRATFKVDGGMPQHNHGLPTRPLITQSLGHGTFLMEGVKFNMSGAWELKIDIEADKLKDSVHFQILIDLPPTGKLPKPYVANTKPQGGK